MGSGASAQLYDQDFARELAGSLWDAKSWNEKIEDEEGCTLGVLEEAAGVVALPFPLDGLTFELTSYGARRCEENGDNIIDVAGGAQVQAPSLVAQSGTSLAWEGAVGIPDGVTLGNSYTLAVWFRIATDVQALDSFTPLISCEGGDSAIVLRSNGRVSVFADGKAGDELPLFEDDRIDGSRWILLFASAASSGRAIKGVKESQRAPTSFFVAYNQKMVQQLGEVKGCSTSGCKIRSIGGPGLAVSEAYMWDRELSYEEKSSVFVRGAARHAVFEDKSLVQQLLTGQGQIRSEDNATRFAALLASIAEDVPSGIADVSDWGLCDGELDAVLYAVQCNTKIVELRLCRNEGLSSRGASKYLLAFIEVMRPAFILNLTGCSNIGSGDNGTFEASILDAFASGPEVYGVVIKAEGTGLSADAISRLSNATDAATAMAAAFADAVQQSETQQAGFVSMQQELDAVWAAEADDAELSDADLDAAVVRLQALASSAPEGSPALLPPELAELAPEPVRSEPLEDEEDEEYHFKGKKKGRRPGRRAGESKEAYEARLAEAKRKYQEYLAEKKTARWALKKSATKSSLLEDSKSLRGSGMLMAHFAYIGGIHNPSQMLSHAYFGLKHAQVDGKRQLKTNQTEAGAVEFWAAVSSGVIQIVEATGHSFGKRALHLAVQNKGSSDLNVVLCAGTIFEHIDWVHRQNLMVISHFTMRLPRSSTKRYLVDAHCMNSMCCCSSGDTMYLTDYYFTDWDVLPHQGLIWDHFSGRYYGQKKHLEEQAASR